jgi:hypothetical protein
MGKIAFIFEIKVHVIVKVYVGMRVMIIYFIIYISVDKKMIWGNVNSKCT